MIVADKFETAVKKTMAQSSADDKQFGSFEVILIFISAYIDYKFVVTI